MPRDEFPRKVKLALAARAGHRCSRSECRASTSGPGDEPTGVINIGVAAHITAAAAGGPRYDASLTVEQRCGIDNAIWLCRSCGDMVDDAPVRFTVSLLNAWKHQAEEDASRRVGRAAADERMTDRHFSDEELAILAAAGPTRTGEIHVLSTNQTGEFVTAGGEDFYDPNDWAVAAAHYEALESLRRRGLVRHVGGVLYQLTGSGFKVGRALISVRVADRNPPSDSADVKID